VNGRLGGTRRDLTSPLTLVGRAPECEIRLNVEGVHPFHCALAVTPEGLLVRDFQNSGTTQVNGQPVTACTLQDRDLLSIGPFQFQVSSPPAAAVAGCEASKLELEALRIQAAAVAAQQAALTEEELRLQQRSSALEQQERQLAEHLEDKRQRLLALRDEARQADAGLRREREDYEKRVAQVLAHLEQSRRDINDNYHQLKSERQRLVSLRLRLKRRWHRHWAGERQAMRKRETELAGQYRTLEKQRERLQQEKTALAQAQLRFNGDSELTRRQLQSESDRLGREQEQLEERQRALEQAANQQVEADQRLRAEQERWHAEHQRLTQELDSLESRIRNYRRKLQEQQQEVIRLEAVIGALNLARTGEARPTTPTVEPALAATAGLATEGIEEREWKLSQAEAELLKRTAAVESLAAELADQRLLLAEECERLAQTQVNWQREQDAAAELEALGLGLQKQEETFQLRAQGLEAAEHALQRRHEELIHARRNVEAWKARLAAGAAAWQGERERVLTAIQCREQELERRETQMLQLRQRWDDRRRRQVLRLRAQRNDSEETRRQGAASRETWDRERTALAREQRALAERALALEQLWQECLGKSANPTAAEKRLEQLRRQWTALFAGEEKFLARERQWVVSEAARLEARLRQLEQQTDQITAGEADLASRQAAWEQERALAETDQGKLRQEIESLRKQRELYEQQLQELAEEVERLARFFLDEGEATTLPAVQAA
jgi:chromosome segregation ATPase